VVYLKDVTTMLIALAGLACTPTEGDQDLPTDTSQAPSPPTSLSAYVASPEAACVEPAVILCEDFETDNQSSWSDYEDNGFVVMTDEALSGSRSMRQYYQLGQVDAGWLAWFFGDHPLGGTRSGESFEEIYFRWYHKYQDGWPPNEYPEKMARVRSHYVDCAWCFAWAEHFWVHADGTALSDPVSNIPEPSGTVLAAERWLGTVDMNLNFPGRGAKWMSLEMRVKLNTPGQSDGRITFWADDQVVLDRQNLNLRGAYDQTTINVAMIDTYWNESSPVEGLRRWYDNVVLSTQPIGCAVPTIQKSALTGQTAWEVEVAEDTADYALVWSSGAMVNADNEVDMSPDVGTFAAGHLPCDGPDDGFVVRARHQTAAGWSDWTEWVSLF
jgi:hypothetical protein